MKKSDEQLFQEFLAFKKFQEESNEAAASAKKIKKKETKTSGYTKRADGRLYTTVTVGRDPETGKPLKVPVYGKTVAELKDNVSNIKLEKKKGTNFSKRNITMKTYRESWFEKKKMILGDNSIKTLKMYTTIFNNYFVTVDFMKLIDIEPDDIQTIINQNASKKRTCQQIRMVYNEIFKSAIADRIISFNPIDNVVTPAYKSPERRPLTDDEDYLSEVSEFSDREKAFIQLIKYAGLRKEEALALIKADFDFTKDQISISKAIIFDNNKPILKDTKNVTSRLVPMLPNTKLFISYYISNLPSEILFTNMSNTDSYITDTGYKRMWESIIKKMKLKAKECKKQIGDDLTAHIFRHNYACMLMYADVDMKERQYLLGHKTISVTMDIYTHIEESKLKAPNQLERYVTKQLKHIQK